MRRAVRLNQVLFKSLTARSDSTLSRALLSLRSAATEITVSSSSWIATDRYNEVTEMINRLPFSLGHIIPRTPASGPVSTTTGVPSGRYRHGSRKKLLEVRSRKGSISSTAISTGFPAKSDYSGNSLSCNYLSQYRRAEITEDIRTGCVAHSGGQSLE